MIRHLRIVCPICILCLAALVFCFFGMHTKASSAESQAEAQDEAVTYTADSWSASGMAVAVTAVETATAPKETEDQDADTYSDEVPAQEHRDSGYVLSDEERRLVESAVMCEAGGEGERGQMMVAQSILDGALRNGYTVTQSIDAYHIMTTSYSRVTDEVKNSVSRVFDNGERVTEEKADLWYNPALTVSEFHEAQEYVITVGKHRFFWMIKDDEA